MNLPFDKRFPILISRLPSLPAGFCLDEQRTHEEECYLSSHLSSQVHKLERQLSLLPQRQKISLTQVTAGSGLRLISVESNHAMLTVCNFILPTKIKPLVVSNGTVCSDVQGDKIFCEMKAIEQKFHVVLFIMLYKLDL